MVYLFVPLEARTVFASIVGKVMDTQFLFWEIVDTQAVVLFVGFFPFLISIFFPQMAENSAHLYVKG